ncbi:exophilin-5 isoform X3 [Erinaceus europaeus]|nr:exophilin-5 isoform X3 [Erinaceus europaeus]
MLKQPLTYRLRRGMAEKNPVELQTSRSKNMPHQRNTTSFSSRLSFRSSFASLFSFRKSRKDLKLQSLGLKGCDSHAGPPVSVRGTASQAKMYNSPLENQAVGSAFVPKPADMREGSHTPPWDNSLLENEFFQVLDDLDSKLAQEQFSSSVNTRTPFNYGSRTQPSYFHSTGNRRGNTTGRDKNHYNETSNMSIYDILRPGTPREGFKTFSPRTKTIYDMYRTKQSRVITEDYMQKNTFGSTSLCLDSQQRSASSAAGHFTARSLHFPGTVQSKSGFKPPNYQQSPKRTPLSSIIWNRSDSFRDRQNQEVFLEAPSPMEIDLSNQRTNPRCFRENTKYEFYRSQSFYQNVSLNAPMDNAMSSDPFENSENMPFYTQNNPFARTFFSNTFGQNREQMFGQSPFWGQQEEHSSWSDFHQSRKPFIFSDRDFEMISIEENHAPTGHSHHVPSQDRGPFSHSYRSNIFRDQKESHPWQFDPQTCAPENMEVPQDNDHQSTLHFNTPNVYSTADSRYHIKSGGLGYQKESSPTERHINKDPYSFGIRVLASSFKTSLPQIYDDKRNSQSPIFQNPTINMQKTIPSKSVCLPRRSYTEATVTNSDSNHYPPLTESQVNILVTDVSNEKDLNESILEKSQQLNKMDQTSMAGEILQPISQTVISNPLPDFQNSLTQDSVKSDRFAFNTSTTISSKRSPSISSKKDNPKLCTSHRDKASGFKKGNSCIANPKLDSAVSLPFIQESRATSSFPSPNQDCHQEQTENNEVTSGILQNNHSESVPTDKQNTQSPEKSAVLDAREEQYKTTHSVNCSKSVSGPSMSDESLGLSSSTCSDSLLVNNSILDAPAITSTIAFSGRSPSGPDPSLEERGEKDCDSKNQKNQFASNHFGNQKSNERDVPIHNEMVGVAKYDSHLPLWARKGRGKVRQRISCIENLNKTENRSTAISDNSDPIEVNQSNFKAPEPHTTYCTLPRKSASILNSRKSDSDTMTSSLRNKPVPFQTKNTVEKPRGQYTSNKFSLSSLDSENKFSRVVLDFVPVATTATEGVANKKTIESPSVRKKTLPFLIKRAVSCPSGVPYAANGRDGKERCLASDSGAPAAAPVHWERVTSPLKSDSAVKDYSLTERYHQNDCFQECTERDSENADTRTFSLSNEDPLPFSSDMSEQESWKSLHKWKTTSTFSVSGDEDNVKCLEVVSIYYTLPRKHGKKIGSLLQKCTQNTNSFTESPKVEADAFKKNDLNHSTQEQVGTSSSEDLNMLVNSAQNNHCLSHTTGNRTVLQSPNVGSSSVSLHKGDSKTREMFLDHLSKSTLSDSQSRKEREKKLQSETLHRSPVLPGKKVKAKSESHQQCIKSANSGPASSLAHSEETSQTLRNLGAHSCSDIAITAAGNGNGLQKDVMSITTDDSANELQPKELRGEIETHFQRPTDKALCDSETQVFALPPALHKLQLDEETHSSELDLKILHSEPRKLPQRSQDMNMKNKTNLDDLEKEDTKSLAKHRLTAVCKASRKFPAKGLSPRRHVATIFPQSGNNSDFSQLSLDTQLVPKSTDSSGGSRLSDSGVDMETSENPPQVTVLSSREASTHMSNQESDNISQPHQNEFDNISQLPPKCENSKNVAEVQIWGGESDFMDHPAFINFTEADFSDYQRKMNTPCSLEPALQSAIHSQLQRRGPSLEWEPEPLPYRSKSLKNIHLHGDGLRKSQPPKARERHFSESTSIDNALSRLTLGDEFSNNSRYSRRFKSFSELPSCDENESWTNLCPRSATSISRPIDYGIFGKEQQLAFLENVKRSLTQGRLWKPSFLKNPGFLKDEVINPPNSVESSSTNVPCNELPEDHLSPSAPLNIYEEDPMDSDSDTDTTTDDEYYLDENDKESEL